RNRIATNALSRSMPSMTCRCCCKKICARCAGFFFAALLMPEPLLRLTLDRPPRPRLTCGPKLAHAPQPGAMCRAGCCHRCLLNPECPGNGDERPKRQHSDGERQPVS